MKAILILFVLSITISNFSILGQSQDASEDKIYYKLKHRVNFREVSRSYNINPDVIFYSNSGFLINPDWDIADINGIEYVIITYPKYTGNGQNINPKPGPNNQKYVELYKDSSIYPLPIIKVDDAERLPISGYKGALYNDKLLAVPKAVFDTLAKIPVYSKSLYKLKNVKIVSGQLTLPFKLRPKLEDKNFMMTTDVTLGAYGGLRQRIHSTEPNYITIPVVLGLSFININDNSTSPKPSDNKSGITPGWTWASGIIFQFSKLNAGFVFGKDFASGYGDEWIYNGKYWYSFAIGYSFTK